MGKIKITTSSDLKELEKYKSEEENEEENELKKLEFHELIRHEMKKAGIPSAEALAEKMSRNKRYIKIFSTEGIKNYIKGERVYYKENGKRREDQQELLRAMAEALATKNGEQPDTALIKCIMDELNPDTASVNRKIDEQLKEAEQRTDDAFDRVVSIKSIARLLETIPAQQVRLLCKSYPQLLSVPSDANETVALYSWLDEANQAQFLTYMGVLLDESHSELLPHYSSIFSIFEKPSTTASGKLMKLEDLEKLLRSTFPDKEDTGEADAFRECLYWLLNQNYREIVKSFLLLDNDIKREMILRIADQMLVVQKAATT